MNITFYRRRIEKYRRKLKLDKARYKEKQYKNWIEKCKKKIKEIKQKRKKK